MVGNELLGTTLSQIQIDDELSLHIRLTEPAWTVLFVCFANGEWISLRSQQDVAQRVFDLPEGGDVFQFDEGIGSQAIIVAASQRPISDTLIENTLAELRAAIVGKWNNRRVDDAVWKYENETWRRAPPKRGITQSVFEPPELLRTIQSIDMWSEFETFSMCVFPIRQTTQR